MNRKIFIGYMNTQNISKYYGSKLDVILDNSQFYDFTLVKSTEKSEDNPVDVILDYSEYYDFELSLIEPRPAAETFLIPENDEEKKYFNKLNIPCKSDEVAS